MDQEEKKLIYHLQQGDEWAYRQLFDKYYTNLCKVAYGFLGNNFLAKTTVNDVIVYLWENRENTNIRVSLRNYLIGAVRYACMNYFQKKYIQKEINFSNLENKNVFIELSIRDWEYPLGILLEKELDEKIRQTVRRLPKECQKVFYMSRFENMNYEEIAHKLSISVNTVKYHIKSAISKLRQNLKE
jgi:RNA polymerase sigma-70 factor (ECF subfamily)